MHSMTYGTDGDLEEHRMKQVDPETKSLQASIFLSKVARAQQASESEKLAEGPLLFDQNMAVMRGAIKSQFPDWSNDQVDQEIDRRLRMAKRISDAGFYRDAEMADE